MTVIIIIDLLKTTAVHKPPFDAIKNGLEPAPSTDFLQSASFSRLCRLLISWHAYGFHLLVFVNTVL